MTDTYSSRIGTPIVDLLLAAGNGGVVRWSDNWPKTMSHIHFANIMVGEMEDRLQRTLSYYDQEMRRATVVACWRLQKKHNLWPDSEPGGQATGGTGSGLRPVPNWLARFEAEEQRQLHRLVMQAADERAQLQSEKRATARWLASFRRWLGH